MEASYVGRICSAESATARMETLSSATVLRGGNTRLSSMQGKVVESRVTMGNLGKDLVESEAKKIVEKNRHLIITHIHVPTVVDYLCLLLAVVPENEVC